MSKYSTEDMVNFVCLARTEDETSHLRDAIIAKLRAADKLCEAARKMLNGYRDAPHELAQDLRKVIAEYEGNE